jgi:hypothetical protein
MFFLYHMKGKSKTKYDGQQSRDNMQSHAHAQRHLATASIINNTWRVKNQNQQKAAAAFRLYDKRPMRKLFKAAGISNIGMRSRQIMWLDMQHLVYEHGAPCVRT